jgi:hypothetical protein
MKSLYRKVPQAPEGKVYPSGVFHYSSHGSLASKEAEMKRTFSISIIILSMALISFVVFGCGGGGGGSSSSSGGGGPAPLSYSGITTQASITAANAEVLTTEALLGASAGAALTLASSLQVETRPASSHSFIIELPKIFRRSARNADWRPEGARSLQRTEADTIAGSCGGSSSYDLTVDDATGEFAGIFEFSQYCDSGIIVNGRVLVDGVIDSATNQFEVINFNFDNLTSDDFIISGGISLSETGPSALISMNFLVEDSAAAKVYWIKDYQMAVTEINDTDTQVMITGAFYYPDYGYVNLSTPVPLVLVSDDEWPSSGTVRCQGAGNTTASLTAIDNQSYQVVADTDGDAVDEYDSGVLFWADL